GPVGLDEVRFVLNDRLGRLEAPRRVRRYGAVFVAPPNRARGLEFDVVIVPGLAERMFPRKLTEDPILSDVARAQLSPYLARNERRVGAERRARVRCFLIRASISTRAVRECRRSTRWRSCARRRASCPASTSWRVAR